MANQQGVPGSGDRLLKLFGMTMFMGVLIMISPWMLLDALLALIYVTFLVIWATASQPNEEYWIGVQERNDPTL